MTWTGPGFVDHHCHVLLYAGAASLYIDKDIGKGHRLIAERRSTPADQPWSESLDGPELQKSLRAGLQPAAALGLVEITETGLDHWSHFDAVLDLRANANLPLHVKVFVRSGLADLSSPKALAARQTGDAWIDVIGVKFYADGWLGPRTCAVERGFLDSADSGILFMDAETLARRAEPYAAVGLRIATHAIGDRGIEAVLDAYEMIYSSPKDCAMAAPRIEHAQIMRADLVERLVEWGVVICAQPSFAISDAVTVRVGLDADYVRDSYDWSSMLQAGVRVVSGSDYGIEDLSPLVGLQHLLTGAPIGSSKTIATPMEYMQAHPMMTDASAGTVTLDRDPSLEDPASIASIEVLGTSPAP